MTSVYDQLSQIADDDVNVAAPEDYVDGQFGLLPEATYDVVVKDFTPDFRDDGTFSKRITLKRVEVVGVPNEDLKKHLGRALTNLSIFTTTYQRNGATVSGLGDLIRGIDDTRAWSGLKEAVDLIQEAVDNQTVIQMKLSWGAFDKDGYNDALVAAGSPEKKTPEEKEIRKKASVRGMRNFRQLPDGTHAPEVAGPLSGQMLEGRLEIDRVIAVSRKRSMLAS